MVRIRARKHIVQTLDAGSRLEGCVFTRQMMDYCGHDFQVRKIVFHFFDEYKFKMYVSKSPLYILEDLICNGVTDAFDQRCDRSCYLMWHGRWLEKI